eukprot:maker-scaffold357_size197762-snap-gene-0.49 protein:Tk03731 transcript:maker-scaffold357_size197762-snap-gene-0.49-mRNA-1 annotation:"la protein homolog"
MTDSAVSSGDQGTQPAVVPKPDAATDEALTARIIRQVEHYFGDYNLPRDKFLLEKTQVPDGWIPIDVMMKFNRLNQMTSDGAVVLAALQKSQADLLEVNLERQELRRNPSQPVPEYNEARKKMLAESTVYVKGLDKENTSLEELLDHFKQYDNVLNVSMRQFHDKKTDVKGFKGSLFVTFGDRASAEKFMALENLKYREAELSAKWQNQYFADKGKEKEEKIKKSKAEKQKLKEAKKAVEDEEKEKAVESEALPKGAVLVIDKLSSETMREDIKSQLEKDCEVEPKSIAFVYYQKGETEAKLRFWEADKAIQILKKIEAIKDGKLVIKEQAVECRVLEGTEEEEFLKKCAQDMVEFKSNRKGHKRRSGGGGRGGGRGGFHNKRQKRS